MRFCFDSVSPSRPCVLRMSQCLSRQGEVHCYQPINFVFFIVAVIFFRTHIVFPLCLNRLRHPHSPRRPLQRQRRLPHVFPAHQTIAQPVGHHRQHQPRPFPGRLLPHKVIPRQPPPHGAHGLLQRLRHILHPPPEQPHQPQEPQFPPASRPKAPPGLQFRDVVAHGARLTQSVPGRISGLNFSSGN